jgi:hypothetical protein
VGLASSRERHDPRAARMELRRGSTDNGVDGSVDVEQEGGREMGASSRRNRARLWEGEEIHLQFIEEEEREREGRPTSSWLPLMAFITGRGNGEGKQTQSSTINDEDEWTARVSIGLRTWVGLSAGGPRRVPGASGQRLLGFGSGRVAWGLSTRSWELRSKALGRWRGSWQRLGAGRAGARCGVAGRRVQVGAWAAVWSLNSLNGEGWEREGEGMECRVEAATTRARGLPAWVTTGRMQGARARWSVGRIERLAAGRGNQGGGGYS